MWIESWLFNRLLFLQKATGKCPLNMDKPQWIMLPFHLFILQVSSLSRVFWMFFFFLCSCSGWETISAVIPPNRGNTTGWGCCWEMRCVHPQLEGFSWMAQYFKSGAQHPPVPSLQTHLAQACHQQYITLMKWQQPNAICHKQSASAEELNGNEEEG